MKISNLIDVLVVILLIKTLFFGDELTASNIAYFSIGVSYTSYFAWRICTWKQSRQTR